MGFDQAAITGQTHFWFSACARAIALCAQEPRQSEMVQCLLRCLEDARPRDFRPSPLPALAHLQEVKDMKLAREFREFAHFLPWKYSPRTIDQGQEVAIMELGSMFELEEVAAGLMYVDSHQVYPEHNHPPDEMYFLISGTARWRYGGHHDYRSVTAGNILYNHPWNWHGVKAGATPVLALFLLCSG